MWLYKLFIDLKITSIDYQHNYFKLAGDGQISKSHNGFDLQAHPVLKLNY